MNLIRVAGTPNWVEFDNGVRIYNPNTDKLFVAGEGWNRYVKKLDYDNHFIGLNDKFLDIVGSNFAYCSCGSPAVVAGYNMYKQGASAGTNESGMIPGEMLVCMIHAETGKHLDGST